MRAETGPADLVLAVVGRVRPRDLVEVRAERPGAVVDLLADEGDRVQRGQPLARVRAEQERAALDTAQAEARALEAEVVLAAREFERSSELFRNGWITRARLDRDRAALATARVRQPRRPRSAKPSSNHPSMERCSPGRSTGDRW